MISFTAHSEGRTPGSPCGRICGVPALCSPTENTSVPATGCPSPDTTRQLSACVPLRSDGKIMVTVALSATVAGAMTSPLGPTRLMTKGETGSLNVSVATAGGSAKTAPSAGCACVSAACPNAGIECAIRIHSVTNMVNPRTLLCSTRKTGSMECCGRFKCSHEASSSRQQPQSGGRLRTLIRMIRCRSACWNLDPAGHTLFTLLHDRKIDRRARLEVIRDRADEHEFVVVSIRQLTSRPGDLGHPLAHLGAPQRIGFRIFCALGLKLPAGLRHWFDIDHAVSDANAD